MKIKSFFLIYILLCLVLFANAQVVIQWQKTLGGTTDDGVTSIQQTTDGGYVITGSSTSNDGDVTGHHGTIGYFDYWVVKLDSAGSIEWQKSLGGTDHDVANSIQQTADGGYIVAGGSESNDGDVTGNHGGWGDYWIVKLFPAVSTINPMSNENDLNIYPNPTASNITIEFSTESKNAEISLLNIHGKELTNQHITTDKNTIIKQLNLSHYPNGIYFLSIRTEKENFMQRIMKRD